MRSGSYADAQRKLGPSQSLADPLCPGLPAGWFRAGHPCVVGSEAVVARIASEAELRTALLHGTRHVLVTEHLDLTHQRSTTVWSPDGYRNSNFRALRNVTSFNLPKNGDHESSERVRFSLNPMSPR